MQVINAGRRLLVSAVLLSLAACTTQGKIGDTSRPLMPPDTGLVAATVSFTNSVQPKGMKFNSFNFGFWFDRADGQPGNWVLNSPRDASFISKDPRALPDDTPPKLVLSPFKPGKYRLTRIEVSQDSVGFTLRPKQVREFEVVAGQVTYVGSMMFNYASKFGGKYGAQLEPTYVNLAVRNDFERDVRELRSLDGRLESVVFTNALAK